MLAEIPLRVISLSALPRRQPSTRNDTFRHLPGTIKREKQLPRATHDEKNDGHNAATNRRAHFTLRQVHNRGGPPHNNSPRLAVPRDSFFSPHLRKIVGGAGPAGPTSSPKTSKVSYARATSREVFRAQRWWLFFFCCPPRPRSSLYYIPRHSRCVHFGHIGSAVRAAVFALFMKPFCRMAPRCYFFLIPALAFWFFFFLRGGTVFSGEARTGIWSTFFVGTFDVRFAGGLENFFSFLLWRALCKIGSVRIFHPATRLPGDLR